MGLQFRFKNVYITDYNWIQIRLNTSLENYDLEAIYWSSVLFYISGEMTVKHIRVCKRFCVQEWYVNIVLFTCKVRVKYIASDGRVVRRKKSTTKMFSIDVSGVTLTQLLTDTKFTCLSLFNGIKQREK